jgi:hypothetical protein
MWKMTKPEQKRLPWSRLVPPAAVLVLLAIGVAAYYQTTGFFGANGTWYGPMRIKVGGTTVAIEAYMDLATSPIGDISGRGILCSRLSGNASTFDYSLSGRRAYSHPGQSSQSPITLTAQLGTTPLIGPTLQMRGDATNGALHLTGVGRNVATTLDMTHGTQAAFTAACKSLSPLG